MSSFFDPRRYDKHRRETEPEQTPEADPGPGDEIDEIMVDPVLRWRAERLVAAGLNPRQARAIALRRHVDLHFVTDTLLARGCPPDLAFDIAS